MESTLHPRPPQTKLARCKPIALVDAKTTPLCRLSTLKDVSTISNETVSVPSHFQSPHQHTSEILQMNLSPTFGFHLAIGSDCARSVGANSKRLPKRRKQETRERPVRLIALVLEMRHVPHG